MTIWDTFAPNRNADGAPASGAPVQRVVGQTELQETDQ